MIVVAEAAFKNIDQKLNEFLKYRLPGLQLSTMSVIDDRVSLHYQYQKKSSFNAMSFTSELRKLTEPADVEVYIG
jgi:5,10-methylene-tetrahydrofolate dehydrogenase/methenyl tetrahydrofolate cyclohydrolase